VSVIRNSSWASGDASARFEAIVLALLGEPNSGTKNRSKWRYGTKAGLSIDLTRNIWFAHDGGRGGGLFDLVVYLGHAKSRAGAAEWLRAGGWLDVSSARCFGGETLAQKLARQETEANEAITKRDAALAIWKATKPIFHTPAYVYLNNARCVSAASIEAAKASLRFHPNAPLHPYSTNARHTFPALIAKCVGADGEFVGVHITFLAANGSSKASLPTPRKMCGSGFMGASIRLGQGDDVVVAEGIESALSVGSAFGLSPIAALSASGVKTWVPWAGVASVAFAPDIDVSGIGMAAARSCAERLYVAGVKVQGFAIPPNGLNDWNDAARAVPA
jgi:putative DNA primase/helicase